MAHHKDRLVAQPTTVNTSKTALFWEQFYWSRTSVQPEELLNVGHTHKKECSSQNGHIGNGKKINEQRE